MSATPSVGLGWSDLRTLHGSQHEGSEELCAQLERLKGSWRPATSPLSRMDARHHTIGAD